jgi:uncharacterized NAD-dependent epimerase/dehydratase family protein
MMKQATERDLLMLKSTQKIAIYLQGSLGDADGKMGYGVLRFSPNPVCCVIDSRHSGKSVSDVIDVGRDCAVVASIGQAVEAGAEVLVLGIAPSGGRIPEDWLPALNDAIDHGLCIVNGLHDFLADRFVDRLSKEQWIWDVRQVGDAAPPMASGKAAQLTNKRLLMVGTDMAIGKMTVALEMNRHLLELNRDSVFIATGQIGLTVSGFGVPLDAVKVDHACGWVESKVLEMAQHDIVLIEGQGSLLHPGSSATLSLMRGGCPTHLVLCHKAGMTHVDSMNVKIPPLKDVIALNEITASGAGALTQARTIGIALNTYGLDEAQAVRTISSTEDDTGLPVTDVVRYGASKLTDALI